MTTTKPRMNHWVTIKGHGANAYYRQVNASRMFVTSITPHEHPDHPNTRGYYLLSNSFHFPQRLLVHASQIGSIIPYA